MDNKIIDFAEKVYLKDRADMQKTFDFEEFIKPLFKLEFGSEYRREYLSIYCPLRTDFIEQKRKIFNNQSKNI